MGADSSLTTWRRERVTVTRHRETLKTWNPQQRDEMMSTIANIMGAVRRNDFPSVTITATLLVDGEAEGLPLTADGLSEWLDSRGTLMLHIKGPHDSGMVWWEDTPEGPFGPTAEWSSSIVQRFLASLAQAEDLASLDDLDDLLDD